MRLEGVAKGLAKVPAINEIFSGLSEKTTWSSLCAEARPCLLAALYFQNPRKILLVANSYDRALAWVAKLVIYGIDPGEIKLLPSGLSALYEDAAPETVALSDRIGSLQFLASSQPGIVIATPGAVLERTLGPEDLRDHFLRISVGEETDARHIAETLVRLGYERGDPVRIPGQFSMRGGILDVFPMGADVPTRVEFFGDEVESLRQFDPMTQRSIRRIDTLEVSLSRETLLPSADYDLTEDLERSLTAEAASMAGEAAGRLEELVKGDMDALSQRIHFDRLDLYRPMLQPDGPCAIDYLDDDGLLVLDEPLELEATIARAEEELADALKHRHERGEILEAMVNDFVWAPDHFSNAPNILNLTQMNAVPNWIGKCDEVEVQADSLETYRGRPQALTSAIKSWQSKSLSIALGTDQPTRSKSVLAQVEIFPTPTSDSHPFGKIDAALPVGLHLFEGNPAGGFLLPIANFCLITDHELFGVARLKLPQRKFSEGVPIANVLDLKEGDYVVHINFGIGIYRGLVKRVVEGVEKEFLHIDYKAPDKLFVPADQLDRVQKFLAPGDQVPKVNRLTGGEWKKIVSRAREEAREFARDLINLYARRKETRRPSYGSDSETLLEMEGTFPWAETPSQHQAIEDVKSDLRTEFPMDRLVCGDVGFGKTEVAVRAAYKVAEAGKQVAVLCPTTILSEQHYRTFAERLAGFSVEIRLLNRFVSGRDRTQTLKDLEAGKVQIIIGTHALLGNDLKFKELGLLIIDEEQKFGVKHKETLKNLRVNVDVLSMSATPIPRTLSMALMDIRQMSLINDPPPGRLPIRTFVRPYSTEVVREALLRELARGGQVFYVSNRVQGIYHVAEKLRKLVPSARIAVGHGQMTESELEPVMVGFIKGEIDILVSTTIVESGLDIPNANTLIVENSDRFGLSPLYQLRGRVGRSDRQAYAYLLYSDESRLTEQATERLKALAEFSQLGSGYSLAFRDLQIRGAGDLLGAKQSGQMTSVGFDLYSQLIESEVSFLKTFADGERPTGYEDPLVGLEPLPSFDLPVTALIPNSYIADEGQRLYFYRQLMTARDPEQLAEVASDLQDRYGQLPLEVKNAIDIMSVRLKARDLHVISADGSQGRISIRFSEAHPLHPRVPGLLQSHHKAAYMSSDKLIWPYQGNPIQAAHAAIDAIYDALELMESQRAALGISRD
ncbi:transcription-repair coupling factor [Kamptonema cortianum]|nr:transcription-repair coupling factor [Geitlerinema splendidum]MDK3155207.1 transcription-repair coupling factor [Kamptonema cortianum]